MEDHLLIKGTERFVHCWYDSRASFGPPRTSALPPPWRFRTYAETHGYCMDLWQKLNDRNHDR